MASNLVDLKLLNTAYGINKKRIDNLSKKVITNTLEVGTTTVTGTAKVTGGTLTTNTLNVTGDMTIDGSVSTSKALTLSNGGTVNGSTTLDSLTGSIKIGSATDASGNATGVASVVVPSGKALTISGTATASNLSLGGSATIESSTIKNATLDGGTVNLNSKTLTVNTSPSGTSNNGTITSSTIGSSGTTTIIKGGTINLNEKTLTINNTSDGVITSSIIGKENTTTTIQNGTINLNEKIFTIVGAPNEGVLKYSEIGSGSLADKKTTINNGTIDLNEHILVIKDPPSGTNNSGVLKNSVIGGEGTTTIQNGTINLSENTLTVTSDSTITNITSGSTVTLEGVGAIDAKSMTLTDTSDSSTSLYIKNKFGKDNPTSGVALKCDGGISAAKVYNAVWNDLADSIEVPQDTELEYGYCYKYKNGKVYKTDEYADPNVLGIHSDTAGMVLGIKPSHIKCINLAVAGVVLAYVDNEYECGTPLVATKEGKLTKANKITRVLNPERIVATYFRKENNDFWGPSSNKIAVNGRSWVKVK